MSQLSQLESSVRTLRIKSVLASVICVGNGMMILQDDWDASGNTMPSSSVRRGYVYPISVRGDIPYGGGSVAVEVGQAWMAKIDNPGNTITNWLQL